MEHEARPPKRQRVQERKRYNESLPSLRALYRARIADAVSIATKIHSIEEAESARAAEEQTSYGKAANE